MNSNEVADAIARIKWEVAKLESLLAQKQDLYYEDSISRMRSDLDGLQEKWHAADVSGNESQARYYRGEICGLEYRIAEKENELNGFAPGDVVVLKSGSVPMTVGKVNRDRVECYVWGGGKMVTWHLSAAAVKKNQVDLWDQYRGI